MTIAAVTAFLAAAAFTPGLARWARRRNLLDVPNERSSHLVATPRTGGAAFVLALLVALFAVIGSGDLSITAVPVVAFACLLALVGFIDDLRSLPAAARLVMHLGVAAVLVWAAGAAALPSTVPYAVAFALTVLWMTAVTNAFNFMDGIDGLAGSQAVIAGLGWAAVGRIVGSPDLTALGIIVAAATAGFLLHNWPPAKVFMGDAGSGFLGFVFSALPLVVRDHGLDGWLWAALLVWPFLFDTGFTLLRRARRRENLFAAHRSHLYQRLTATGHSHLTVTLLYSMLAAIGAAAAAVLALGRPGTGVLALAVVGLCASALWRYVVAREVARSAAVTAPRS